MGTTGATEDTMAATVITPGEDAVAMGMAATDTTAAKRHKDGNKKGNDDESNLLQLKIRSLQGTIFINTRNRAY